MRLKQYHVMEMYKRKEIGSFIWIFPLIAGICTVISILTPTATTSMLGGTWSWWMWDMILITHIGYTPEIYFVAELDFIVPSIITTSAILLSAVNLFILVRTTKKRGFDTKDFILMSIVSAVLSMGIMIYYAFAVAFAFNNGFSIDGTLITPVYHFWVYYNTNYGMYFPFISAILSIIGLGLFRHFSNKRGDFASLKPSPPPETHVAPPKSKPIEVYPPTSVPVGTRNYCPKCGNKLARTDANFCDNCGFKF